MTRKQVQLPRTETGYKNNDNDDYNNIDNNNNNNDNNNNDNNYNNDKNNNNNNKKNYNDNTYLTRVAQPNTGFEFHCGPQFPRTGTRMHLQGNLAVYLSVKTYQALNAFDKQLPMMHILIMSVCCTLQA